mmetsp:Transcript_19966/g.59487  ORF Transcript_19966/g.59487 Transcript_19966/m.59487 type:complete len:211 (+) Transcript_19966:514-1146(+)
MRRSRSAASPGSRGARRSTLFTTRTGTSRAAATARSAARVWTHTPSAASTTTRAPSARRQAARASCPKSTWPGVSTTVTRYVRVPGPPASPGGGGPRRSCATLNADSRSVIPRSCSSGVSSRYRRRPARRAGTTPFSASSQSTRLLLPWSTWPRTHTARVRRGSFARAASSAAVGGRRRRAGGGGGSATICLCGVYPLLPVTSPPQKCDA